MEREYRSRIVELQIVSGQVEGLGPVSLQVHRCAAAPVMATFYNETDPASAVIAVGTDQVMAFRQPAASGSSYAASNVDYREHQGAVTIEWFGATLACTRVTVSDRILRGPRRGRRARAKASRFT